MTNMLGSAEKAAAFVKELQDFAAHTPFEMMMSQKPVRSSLLLVSPLSRLSRLPLWVMLRQA